MKELMLFLCLILAGCAHPSRGVNLILDCSLPPGSVKLLDCSLDDPPKCKTSRIKYPHGCATVELTQP